MQSQNLSEDERGIQIDREHLAPLLESRSEDGLSLLPPRARAVDEDRDLSQQADRLLGEAPRTFGAGQVANHVGFLDVGAQHARALIL